MSQRARQGRAASSTTEALPSKSINWALSMADPPLSLAIWVIVDHRRLSAMTAKEWLGAL